MISSGGDHKRTAYTPETAIKALRIMGFSYFPVAENQVVISHPAIKGAITGEIGSQLVSKAIRAMLLEAKAMNQAVKDALEVDC